MVDRQRRRGSGIILAGIIISGLLIQSYPVMGKVLQSVDSPRTGIILSGKKLTEVRVAEIEDQNLKNTAAKQEGQMQIEVSAGDTLWDLARYFGTTVQEIMKLNPDLKNPAYIQTGDKLWVVPGTSNEKEGNTTQLAYHSVSSRGGNNVSVSKEEFELLARVIYAEARGEDFEGQVAVGAVVLNRVESPYFPNTVREVIYQPGAFTAVNDRQIRLEPDEEAYAAAQAALNGQDPSNGALFYYNPELATDRWIKTRTVVKTIGNHKFSI